MASCNCLKRVQVFHLCSGSKRFASDFTDRQVDISTHGTFLQLAVRYTEILHHTAQFFQICNNFFCSFSYPVRIRSRSAAHRFGYNPPVNSLPTHHESVYLHPLPYASHGYRYFFLSGRCLNLYPSIMADWQIQLGNLIVLRVIRIEIILSVKFTILIDLAVCCKYRLSVQILLPFCSVPASDPGIPVQTGQVCVFGAPPNAVEHPQKIFVFVASSTWTSRPMTVSYCFMPFCLLSPGAAGMHPPCCFISMRLHGGSSFLQNSHRSSGYRLAVRLLSIPHGTVIPGRPAQVDCNGINITKIHCKRIFKTLSDLRCCIWCRRCRGSHHIFQMPDQTACLIRAFVRSAFR